MEIVEKQYNDVCCENDDYNYIICPKCNNEIVINGVR